MAKPPGTFIALEGSDGSGKATQLRLLEERLKAVGYKVEVFDFPRYDEPSSYFVRQYLNGRYGPASAVSPYTASLFYAFDRFETAPAIREALKAGKIVLSNRYVGSNMAHQGSKFRDPVQQRGFFVWEDNLEFQMLGIPRPDLNLFLRVPADVSYKLISQKVARDYTDKTHDEHEADIDHLRRSVATFDLLCQLFPKDFKAIDCSQNGRLQSIPEINNQIWELLQPTLPKKEKTGRGVVVRLDSLSTPDSPSPRSKQPVTKSELPLEAVDKIKNVVLGANKISLLATSDLEGTSELVIQKELPWKAVRAARNYYSLSGLPKELTKLYTSTMEHIAANHQQMWEPLKRHLQPKRTNNVAGGTPEKQTYNLLQPVIPMAALTSVSIEGSPSVVERLFEELKTKQLKESRWLAKQLETSAKKQIRREVGAGVSKPSLSEQPQMLNQAIAELAQSMLSKNLSASNEPIQLLGSWPRNEFEILVDGIYPYTALPRNEIVAEIDQWQYSQKSQALNALLAQADNPVLDEVRYHWDIISDRLSLQALLKYRLIENLQIQLATPRYGYEVAAEIEAAGLDEIFTECFDLSLELFSALQRDGREDLAGYATLLGHRVRWQFTTNARLLINAPASDEDILSYGRLLRALKEKIVETHPLVGGALLRQSSEVKKKPSKGLKKMPPDQTGSSSNRRQRPKKTAK